MNKFFILVFSSFIVSCGARKQEKPEWVKSRPIDSSYYIGIGISKKDKSQTQNQYIELAKKNALNDMAGEISTKISNNSALNTMDLGGTFNEEFISKIKTSYSLELEGYEQVGIYENENEIWIYYRLNKAAYQFRQEQKRDNAISKATDFYKKAQKSNEEDEYEQTLGFYINALESLKEYLGENRETSVNGKKIFLSNEIVSEIQTLLNDIRIETVNNEINIKRGEILGKEMLRFFIKNNRTGAIIKNLPLEFSYTEKPISNQRGIIYNLDNSVSYDLGKITSKKKSETFSVRVNILDFIKNKTSDPIIFKMLEKVHIQSAKVLLNINIPSIYINISEVNISSNIYKILSDTFEKEQIKITSEPKDADFLLLVNIEIKEKEVLIKDKLFLSELEAKFEFFNSKNEILSKYNLSNIKSTGSNFKEAGEKSCKEAEKEVKFKISRQLYREVFEK